MNRSVEVAECGKRYAVRRNRRGWRRGGGRRSGTAIVRITDTASHKQATKKCHRCREHMAPILDPHGLQGSVLRLALTAAKAACTMNKR